MLASYPAAVYALLMRKPILLAVCLSIAAAQETRHEITTKTSPEDLQPNSAKVPEAYAVSTQFTRVVILRFKYQANLLAGIERLVKEQNIRNAVILSAFGSVRNYEVHQVSNRTLPSKNMFVEDPTAPADILGMSGFVMNGRVHAHINLSDPRRAFGGHLEPKTDVFTFAVVTLGVLPDNLDTSRFDDKNYR